MSAEQPAPLALLAFAPHPDDAELFCGGLLALSASRGYRVGVVDLTAGERATRGDVATRAAEAAAASAVLGLAHRECLGLPDGGLAPFTGAAAELDDPSSPVMRVVGALRRLRPAVVLLPPRVERHPDHENAGALLRRALFLAGLAKIRDLHDLPPHTPKQALIYPMRVELPVSFVVDISAVADVKRAAIAAHASQVAASPHGPLIGSPLALQALEARDRYHGAMIGVAHGEPYVSESALAVDDPVAFFGGDARRPHLFPRRLP